MSKTVHLLAIFAFIVVSALGFPGIVSSGEQAQVQTKERERAQSVIGGAAGGALGGAVGGVGGAALGAGAGGALGRELGR